MRPAMPVLVLLLLLCCCPLATLAGYELGSDRAPAAAEAAPATASATAASAVPAATVFFLSIEREIDPLTARYYRRAVADARKRGATHIVVRLSTPGGRLDSAIEMLRTALGAAETEPTPQLPEIEGMPRTPQPPRAVMMSTATQPRMIAYVDDHCYSAGALIAYGHHEIHITGNATLGDIGVMMQKADGSMEYAPEKAESVVRALLRSAAQSRGWDAAKLQKMTARNQELYRFDLDGKEHFVLEDDLATWLRAHPTVDADDKIVVSGKDRLLTYTGNDAVAAGMATALVGGLPDVYRRIGVDPATVVDLSPTQVERVSWLLAGWAPILAALAALCVFLEFKTAGTGIWTIFAIVFGVAFLICQYYQDLANYPEVIVLVLGLACVALELFVLPTGGILLITGLALACSALLLAFMPDATQFKPGTAGWGDAVGEAFQQSLLAIGVATVGAAVLIATLPNSRAMRRLALNEAIGGTSDAPQPAVGLAGRSAVARSDLAPTGSIVIDGREHSATSEHGEFIAAGTRVEVVELRFGAAVVRAAATSPGTPS